MYESILIPTDGSDRTREAVAHGLGLAETYGATVHALYVADTDVMEYDNEGFDDSDVIEMLVRRGRRMTDAITQQASDRGLETEGAVVQGSPSQAILRYAAEHDVDLIAMGTRGRSGLARYLLGSVAESVISEAERPVLTARGAVAAQTTGYDHILFPTDGGSHAERVAEHAFDIASHYGATVHALSVIDTGPIRSSTVLAPLEEESERALEATKRHGQQQGVEVVTDVWRGTPSDCITTYATEADVDLITIGAHERRGLDRFLTQSIANRVVRTANCPVVTLSKRRE
jgi:nucleotide-binding universal stress UspA family protein